MKNLKAKLNAKKRKGFTIVELIVVMAIIAILTLIAVPTFTKFLDQADTTQEAANASTLYKTTMNQIVLEISENGGITLVSGALPTGFVDAIVADSNVDDADVNVLVAGSTVVPNEWTILVPVANGAVDETGDILITSPSGATYTNGNAN